MSDKQLDSRQRDDARARPRQEFGIWQRDGEQLRVSWHKQTGELHAMTASGSGKRRLLATLPPSGHPDPRRRGLIAEAVLSDWAKQSGRPGSLDWLERRLAQPRQARLEPIDWTVACPREGCPRHNEPIPPDNEDWGESCDSCLGPRLVQTHGLSPAQLEAALRAGRWQLADAGRTARGATGEAS